MDDLFMIINCLFYSFCQSRLSAAPVVLLVASQPFDKQRHECITETHTLLQLPTPSSLTVSSAPVLIIKNQITAGQSAALFAAMCVCLQAQVPFCWTHTRSFGSLLEPAFLFF